jgi:hypothetical protein
MQHCRAHVSTVYCKCAPGGGFGLAPEPGGRPRFRFGSLACPAVPASAGPVAAAVPAPCSGPSAAGGPSAGESTSMASVPAGCCCFLLRFGVTELCLEVLPLGRPRLRGAAAAAAAGCNRCSSKAITTKKTSIWT